MKCGVLIINDVMRPEGTRSQTSIVVPYFLLLLKSGINSYFLAFTSYFFSPPEANSERRHGEGTLCE